MPSRGNSRRLAGATFVAAVLAITLFPLASATASPDDYRVTEYRYTSASGDWIGQGQSAVVTDPTQIQLSGTARSLQGYVRTEGGWTLGFWAPVGERFRPGVYTHAERIPTGRAPGMDVTVTGRGCNQTFGRFAVNQIRTDTAGDVTALDIRFVQHCDAADAPALRGWFRYRVAPLAYAFTSDPGDSIGGGISKRYEGATTLFTPYEQFGGGARVDVSGERDRWTIVLTPPTGETLEEGKYFDAQRFADATHPGLDVFGNGAGCNDSSGSFTILAVRFDADGVVSRLHARFEQHCEDVEPALHGVIRFHA